MVYKLVSSYLPLQITFTHLLELFFWLFTRFNSILMMGKQSRIQIITPFLRFYILIILPTRIYMGFFYILGGGVLVQPYPPLCSGTYCWVPYLYTGTVTSTPYGTCAQGGVFPSNHMSWQGPHSRLGLIWFLGVGTSAAKLRYRYFIWRRMAYDIVLCIFKKKSPKAPTDQGASLAVGVILEAFLNWK